VITTTTPPTPEEHLPGDEVQLAELLEQALELLEQGQPPHLSSAAALSARGQRLFSDLQLVHRAAVELRSERSQFLGQIFDLSDGQDPTPAHHPRTHASRLPDPFPGELLVRQVLGQGAFGTVYLAEDLALRRTVALKAVLPAGHNRRPTPELLACLREEAQLLAKVDHRHIVRAHAWREGRDGTSYLVLQYVPGGSLADRVRREGPLTWQKAARYIADVSEGLLAVHAQGIVHRDVKPSNILWSPEADEAILTDFGISTRLRSEGGTVGGTPFYMPPEAFGGTVGQKQDVYGLAASLFWLITGDVPFPGPTSARLIEQARRGLPNPDPRCSCLPAPLERLIRLGLAADADCRPTLSAFVASLRTALNQLLADHVARLAGRKECCPIRLVISRRFDRATYLPLHATTSPTEGEQQQQRRRLRDLHLVPDEPERIEVRTGERLRIEVETDRPDGYVTVVNIGPTGNLNRLCPPPHALPTPVEPGRPLRIGETVLSPPTGTERLVAVWSRAPLAVRLDQVLDRASESRPYRATRDMALLEELVLGLPGDDWHAAVVELDHLPAGAAPGERT
jgi:serine/threonine protein kinase